MSAPVHNHFVTTPTGDVNIQTTGRVNKMVTLRPRRPDCVRFLVLRQVPDIWPTGGYQSPFILRVPDIEAQVILWDTRFTAANTSAILHEQYSYFHSYLAGEDSQTQNTVVHRAIRVGTRRSAPA